MHSFKAFISLYTDLSEEDWKLIQSCLTYKIVQQDRVLLNQGTICKNLYFLENGSIRFFTTTEEEENTIRIVHPPSLFTAAESISKQKPSEYSIQAVEESYVWALSRKDTFKLLELPSWNSFLNSYFTND